MSRKGWQNFGNWERETQQSKTPKESLAGGFVKEKGELDSSLERKIFFCERNAKGA